MEVTQILTALNLLKSNSKQSQAVAPVLSGVGNILDFSNQEDNNVSTSLIAGFLKGAGSGIQNGIPSAVAAGVAGAGTNAIGTLNNLEAQQENEESAYLNDIYSSILKEGGRSDDNDPATRFAPWQLEVGETIITPDGRVYDSNADERHEDQVKGVPSDILEDSTYVLPSRRFLTQGDLDTVVGFSTGHYDEGARNYGIEEVLLRDYVGDEELTYAEASLKIQNEYEILDNKKGFNIIDDITDSENLKARKLPLAYLVNLNEERKDKKNTFEDGSVEAVGEMMDGGPGDVSLARLFSSIGLNGANTGSVGFDPSVDIFSPDNSVSSPYDIISDNIDQAEFNAITSSAVAKDRVTQTLDGIQANDLSSFIVNASGIALQDRTVKPRLKRPYLLEDRFRGISPQEIAALTQGKVGAGADVLKNLNADGGSLTSALAPILFARILSQSEAGERSLVERNSNLQKAKLDEVAGIKTENDLAIIDAQNEETGNNNQSIANASKLYGNFIQKRNRVSSDRFRAEQAIERDLDRSLNSTASSRNQLEIIESTTGSVDSEVEARRRLIELELEKLQNR